MKMPSLKAGSLSVSGIQPTSHSRAFCQVPEQRKPFQPLRRDIEPFSQLLAGSRELDAFHHFCWCDLNLPRGDGVSTIYPVSTITTTTTMETITTAVEKL